jgi:cell pole-organizing protein PopZ
VLELLKPLLRQWLDQNMPRLVAEALKGEAARVRGSADGGGKV